MRVTPVALVVSSVSSQSSSTCRVYRAMLFDKLDAAKMHELDASNVSSRVVSRRNEPSVILAISSYVWWLMTRPIATTYTACRLRISVRLQYETPTFNNKQRYNMLKFPVYILASDFALFRLLTWWCHGQFAPPSVNGLSNQQQHPRGMLCLVLSVLPHQCYSSEVDSRQNHSHVHTSNLTEFVSASVTQHFCSVVFGFTSR